jgi:hypothetical protein
MWLARPGAIYSSFTEKLLFQDIAGVLRPLNLGLEQQSAMACRACLGALSRRANY